MKRRLGSWFRRLWISVLAGMGILILSGVVITGWMLYKTFVPERMTVSGRVTDGSGKPIPSAEIRAVPEPVHLDYIEDPIKTGAVVYASTCDSAGQFRLDRVIVSGGVKEGMWIQAYELQISASGYRLALIPFRRPSNQKGDMKIPDVVLEKSPDQ